MICHHVKNWFSTRNDSEDTTPRHPASLPCWEIYHQVSIHQPTTSSKYAAWLVVYLGSCFFIKQLGIANLVFLPIDVKQGNIITPVCVLLLACLLAVECLLAWKHANFILLDCSDYVTLISWPPNCSSFIGEQQSDSDSSYTSC